MKVKFHLCLRFHLYLQGRSCKVVVFEQKKPNPTSALVIIEHVILKSDSNVFIFLLHFRYIGKVNELVHNASVLMILRYN